MPMAVSSLPDTPMNGHSPRNCTSTKLFTRTVLSRIRRNSVIIVTLVFPSPQPSPARGEGAICAGRLFGVYLKARHQERRAVADTVTPLPWRERGRGRGGGPNQSAHPLPRLGS